MKDKLQEQLDFIQCGAEKYDERNHSHALHIANAIRVLLHDTHISTSVLNHLNKKDNIQLLTLLEPASVAHGTVVLDSIGILTIDGIEPDFMRPGYIGFVSVNDWWNQVVLVTGSAKALARDKPFEFEYWALGLVDARPARDRKKGGDSGVDGVIYFFDDTDFTAPKKIIVQVKGGEHIGPNYVRDLNGTVEREKAAIGILITMKSPTKPMKTEAVSAGYYTSKYFNRSVPKIQILTIEELLAGKCPEYYRVPTTFRSAPRKYKNDAFQPNLIDN